MDILQTPYLFIHVQRTECVENNVKSAYQRYFVDFMITLIK